MNLQVTIGTNLFQVLDSTLLYAVSDTGTPIGSLIPGIVVPVVAILLTAIACVFLVLLVYRRRYRAKEVNLVAKMEELKTNRLPKDGNNLSKIFIAAIGRDPIGLVRTVNAHTYYLVINVSVTFIKEELRRVAICCINRHY
jgi:H+/gluconate symporter-like permease